MMLVLTVVVLTISVEMIATSAWMFRLYSLCWVRMHGHGLLCKTWDIVADLSGALTEGKTSGPQLVM